MPQKQDTHKLYDTSAPIITAPDGTKIQITAGRKLQRIRSFSSDPEITDAQFRALACIVDLLNDGSIGDESRHGSAYPKPQTLAKYIAKDQRAVKRLLKELETGMRERRSGGVNENVPCKKVLNVKRAKDEDERDLVNEYRLNEWGAFAVETPVTAPPCDLGSHQSAVTGKAPTSDWYDDDQSLVPSLPVTAPNSSYLSSLENPLFDTLQDSVSRGDKAEDGIIELPDPVETPLPDYRSMSQRERFEFVKKVYHCGGQQPNDDESAWVVFRKLEDRGENLQSIVQQVDKYLDPHLNDGDVCPFAKFLAGFILDDEEYEAVLLSLTANDNSSPLSSKASGIDWENDPPF